MVNVIGPLNTLQVPELLLVLIMVPESVLASMLWPSKVKPPDVPTAFGVPEKRALPTSTEPVIATLYDDPPVPVGGPSETDPLP